MTAVDELPSTGRARTAAEQLLIEQAVMWQARYHAIQSTLTRAPRLLHDDTKAGRAARAAAVSVTEGWSVLYLLAALRDVDPDRADRAARYLTRHAGALSPWMCERLVQRWMSAADLGEPITVPLDQ